MQAVYTWWSQNANPLNSWKALGASSLRESFQKRVVAWLHGWLVDCMFIRPAVHVISFTDIRQKGQKRRTQETLE